MPRMDGDRTETLTIWLEGVVERPDGVFEVSFHEIDGSRAWLVRTDDRGWLDRLPTDVFMGQLDGFGGLTVGEHIGTLANASALSDVQLDAMLERHASATTDVQQPAIAASERWSRVAVRWTRIPRRGALLTAFSITCSQCQSTAVEATIVLDDVTGAVSIELHCRTCPQSEVRPML
jgi:hypothetical protein